jgi:hypothetical protein
MQTRRAEQEQADAAAEQWGELTVDADEPFCLGWRVVAVKLEQRADATHAARWTVRQWAHLFTQPKAVHWARSEECPAIGRGLRKLSRLSFTMRLDGLSPGPPTLMMLDGTSYVVRGGFLLQADGTPIQMRVASKQGPVAQWAGAWLESLDACWHPGTPPGSPD